MSRAKRIVICGGGAIGVSIAYFLSRRGAQPVVIERHAVAGSASGKSGGFLARDWCRGSALDALARRSFDLHGELAEKLGNPWSYRRLETYSGHAAENGRVRNTTPFPWLSGRVGITGRIGSPATTALVEPRAFTTGLMAAAETEGAILRLDTVASLMRGPDGAVHGVMLDSGESVEADAVVVAMGPWSILATRWLPLPAVYGYKGHSLVYGSGDTTGAEALFLEYREASGEVLSPEIFPRADGTTWMCAISASSTMPVDPAHVMGDEGAHARLETMCRNIAPALAARPIIARQACFRPVMEDGLPMIAPVKGAEGAYVATGHNVWGILNAPATGEAMAELILDGAARHVDLAPFTPDRLPRFDPARLRG
jgi:glycine/D-amino acid oxidase-like deaminating enzyme